MINVANNDNGLTRIGVFYDGNYFLHVSNYYLYGHPKKSRISISGLHQFIVAETAKAEDSAARHCRIVDAHYFRGRLSAQDAQSRDLLFRERMFDDILMREGVVSHFLPLAANGEQGIDVWLALEAFEMAIYKRFDVIVLVAADGDYLPLIRKLNTIGTRVMILGWDFEFMDRNNKEQRTRTSQSLLDEATYPILMNTIIDDRSRKTDPLIENLFVKERRGKDPHDKTSPPDNDHQTGTVSRLKEGFGFIKPDDGGKDVFFYHGDLLDVDFNELEPGDTIVFSMGQSEKGPCARNIRKNNTR